ncbi:shikimate dehydrogenase [Segniliparus rugosus]|uniref:Shikimate-5-dehydrogenase n=1 Tax=Segniliparus rugosus (strain ATCC BAA-974 / DSM 45345 / CCUG 50838 / CIP 108380 / JCM 13579 / CDC 945) TaxID=679197 RepID=E5XPD8_SEGRC|nr:shikimate dehydrogenase [Segniliparus rugosus]EFV13783.2 shikimate-5-dehydrogenase [Segniliparus rugosus ATCC BAA-974]
MPRKAGVLGSPIAHSLSPVLHLAAYRALGLDDWTYERIECAEDQLPALVGGLAHQWVGLSVTAPNKLAALAFADTRTELAEAVGSANTLVRTETGWHADCTDVDGAFGALAELGAGQGDRPAVVVGSGGTSLPVVAAFARAGLREAVVVSRDEKRAYPALRLAKSLGLKPRWVDLNSPYLARIAETSAALVNTVPADAVAPWAPALAQAPAVLDVVYAPWPTTLARLAEERGARVVGGQSMLLHQAFRQVEWFTGRPAPKDAMREALEAALAGRAG